MSEAPANRHFQRVKYDVQASLEVADVVVDAKLLDLSLKGALLEVETSDSFSVGQQGHLKFSLGESSDYEIAMDVEIAHCEATTLGVHCLQIDLDSVTHLRRILELYTGDSQIMERELGAMVTQQA